MYKLAEAYLDIQASDKDALKGIAKIEQALHRLDIDAASIKFNFMSAIAQSGGKLPLASAAEFAGLAFANVAQQAMVAHEAGLEWGDAIESGFQGLIGVTTELEKHLERTRALTESTIGLNKAREHGQKLLLEAQGKTPVYLFPNLANAAGAEGGLDQLRVEMRKAQDAAKPGLEEINKQARIVEERKNAGWADYDPNKVKAAEYQLEKLRKQYDPLIKKAIEAENEWNNYLAEMQKQNAANKRLAEIDAERAALANRDRIDRDFALNQRRIEDAERAKAAAEEQRGRDQDEQEADRELADEVKRRKEADAFRRSIDPLKQVEYEAAKIEEMYRKGDITQPERDKGFKQIEDQFKAAEQRSSLIDAAGMNRRIQESITNKTPDPVPMLEKIHGVLQNITVKKRGELLAVVDD